jgi:hypothetical protein
MSKLIASTAGSLGCIAIGAAAALTLCGKAMHKASGQLAPALRRSRLRGRAGAAAAAAILNDL